MSNNLFEKLIADFDCNYNDIVALNNPLECENAFNKLLTNIGYNYNVIKTVMITFNDKLQNVNVDKSMSNMYLPIIKLLLYMKSFGFNNDETLKIFKLYPQLWILNIEMLNNKLCELSDMYGYTKDNLKNMINSWPMFLALRKEHILQRTKELMYLGYTQEQVKDMTVLSPRLFILDIENIMEKDKFYRSIGLEEIFTKSSDSVNYAVELVYARYMFLKSNGIEIDINNCEFLFDKDFQSKYAISNSNLMEKFPYPGDTCKKKK